MNAIIWFFNKMQAWGLLFHDPLHCWKARLMKSG